MANQSHFLIIDSGGLKAEVAVLSGDRLFVKQGATERGQGSDIAGIVDAVIAEARISFSDLSGVIVSLGPGSFTGLRVGLAYAKGLALALKAPLVGVDRIEQSRSLVTHANSFCALRMKADEFYVWSANNSTTDEITVHDFASEADWFDESVSEIHIYWCNEAPPVTANEAFPSNYKHHKLELTLEPLARLGVVKIESGQDTQWAELEPHYGALSAAEKKRKLNAQSVK